MTSPLALLLSLAPLHAALVACTLAKIPPRPTPVVIPAGRPAPIGVDASTTMAIEPTRKKAVLASNHDAVDVVADRTVIVYVTSSERVTLPSAPGFDLMASMRTRLEVGLADHCSVLSRDEVLNEFGRRGLAAPRALVDEQALSVSALSQDDIKRIGQFKIADRIVRCEVFLADAERLFGDAGGGSGVRIPRVGLALQFLETATGEVLWQGRHVVRATDLIERPIRFSRRTLDDSPGAVQSEVPDFHDVADATLAALLKSSGL